MRRIAPDRDQLLGIVAEVFREHGYEGASLALIGEATGLGKGSLYHFFPGGKEEMARAVIAHIDGWFEDNVFAPLRDNSDPRTGIGQMLDATDSYFRSGRRICLIGAFALDESRDLFAGQIRDYFGRWVTQLAEALTQVGHERAKATELAEETVAAIQGALTLARAADDASVFSRALGRMRMRLGLPASD
ncbi:MULTISPECIES: TetR/AcrR family transcriptional regulator [unclassified Mesorhizobium]|uniref:TetR/AcrR family transcriptional regulator n=1 Tax=unclassified Mesorhizobium TaxID=325217 RepID=UPI000FCCB4E4|nr:MULTISPECIES: TetR/AcrR family transcriptional regulator [unclassified Mesorhizobium]RUW32599.1 TetR/AcrR family transcriptional regulator [Mesorhizobium sp. M1E.F.Ca.ET.041.01.1.1]RWB52178.1 MAG: TetR/AcrR family transcriptional regulator [Mesorhizobium sp.]RWD85594.1 MAG: TetR/AcrR family transcriptional regulator [Mesorhizobium sp.]RWD91978.1 MAG: TetR/AcrR family transcriptional regulator [Mesorhizobium sp.]TIV48422.1 MAG: TetR family transcriptional regulator [Mesorhizobium sp.]